MQKIIAVLALMNVYAFAAPCPPPKFTKPAEVKFAGDKALIVTHPSTMWDGRFSSKMGMEAAVLWAKAEKVPVVYLQDTAVENNLTYFFHDCDPDYWVASAGGEFSFKVPVTEVYSVGGHWELCQKNTVRNLFRGWAAEPVRDRRFVQVMDGLYTYGGYFQVSDPYFARFTDFMNVLTYNNPRNSWYTRKLSLLESMGIIRQKDLQIQFLKRNLPPYQQLSPKYAVDLVLDGEVVETLRKSTESGAATLRLEFTSTLYKNGFIPAFVR